MDNVVQSNKCFKSLANALTGFLAAFNMTIDNTMPLDEVFDTLEDGVSIYTVLNNFSGGVYPVEVSTQYAHKAIVLAIKSNGTATFIFIYDGEMYICDVYGAPTTAVGDWHQVTTTAVNTANANNE